MEAQRARKAREVLNEIRWREGMDLRRAELYYADRVRAEGYRIIEGECIRELGRGYFTVEDGMLPYYKILKILYEGEVIFEREPTPSKIDK